MGGDHLWDAIGAVGEVLGAFAVVASLVYVASQVKTSNRLARAEAFRLPNSDLNALNTSFGIDPTWRKLAARAFYEGAQRSDFEIEEAILLDAYFISVANLYEQIFREIREGILDELALSDFAASALLEMPYFKTSWHIYRNSLGPSFVERFESMHSDLAVKSFGEG